MTNKSISLVCLLAMMCISALSHAASYNCAKAVTSIEKLICSNRELSLADERLAVVYREALKSTSNREELKAQQRNWLRFTRDSTNDAARLLNIYNERITVLSHSSVKAPQPDHGGATRTTNDVPRVVAKTTPEPSQPIQAAPAYVPKPVARDEAPATDNIRIIPNFKSRPRPDDIAVVIGIENYKRVPSSAYSASDAGLVKDYLKAIGYQERNITLLMNDNASLADIKAAIESWLPNRIKPEKSRVLVYYSGHGAPEPASGDAYILPYDGNPDYLKVSGYPLKDMYERLNAMKAAEVVVLLDSCFSGAGGRSILPKGARALVRMEKAEIKSDRMVIMSSTQGSQISTSSPDKGHGLFTWHFLKALKDGKKSVAEIYDYVKPNVEDDAKLMNVEQSPAIMPSTEQVRGRFRVL